MTRRVFHLLALTAAMGGFVSAGCSYPDITIAPVELPQPIGEVIDPDIDFDPALTVRTWLNIDAANSWATLALGEGAPLPAKSIEGGFLLKLVLDLDSQQPISGTLELEAIRLGVAKASLAGDICIWPDKNGSSSGTLFIDPVTQEPTVDMFLDAKQISTAQVLLGTPPSDVEDSLAIDLGEGGLGPEFLLALVEHGTADGLFSTETDVVSAASLNGISAVFAMHLALKNGSLPPTFGTDVENFCTSFFNLQGKAMPHIVNGKGSYLSSSPGDLPKQPLRIKLSDLRLRRFKPPIPGSDHLKISTFGSYTKLGFIGDGFSNEVAGVFSADDVLLTPGAPHRVPGAIDAGDDYVTSPIPAETCVLGICIPSPLTTDIPEDFRIDDEVEVAIPAGAEYLFIAPPDIIWTDNSGFGFGVSVEVIRP